MYGDRAEEKTPPAVKRLLREYGGLTPTGLSRWRLVRAGDCVVLVQGMFNQMPKGVQLKLDSVPENIKSGEFLMPRYPAIAANEWILQVWFPPHVWGTVEHWRGERAGQDEDTRLFRQPFPSAGDYFRICGPWLTVERAGDLREPIRKYYIDECERTEDLEAAVSVMMAEEVQQRQADFDWLEGEIHRMAVAEESVLKSISTLAQRVRTDLGRRIGLNEQLGASEAWA